MLREGLRPWSQTMVSEGPRPWGRGRSGDCDFFGGVGSADFIFVGARIFLTFVSSQTKVTSA